VVYLYQAGYLEEAYECLGNVLNIFPKGYDILFELLPAMESDQRIHTIISDKGGRS
jgi:hypothetical protein